MVGVFKWDGGERGKWEGGRNREEEQEWVRPQGEKARDDIMISVI